MSSSTGKGIGRRPFFALAAGAAGMLTPLAGAALTNAVQRTSPATGASAGAAFAPAATRPATVNSAASAPLPADPAVQGLFGDLTPGQRLDRWSIVAVHAVRFGAIPVVLEGVDGSRFQVDVLRRDVAFPGVGNTEGLSVFVANRGNGSIPTPEDEGLGAMALAQALHQREQAGATAPALLTLSERQVRFPGAPFGVVV